MSEQADRDALAEVLAAHHAHVGPVSGAWLCACGAESTNGSIRTGDLTTRAGRCAEHDAHVAGALLDWLAQRDRRVAAEALRETAEGVPLFEFMLVMDVAAEVAPAQIGAWLRERAERIEKGE